MATRSVDPPWDEVTWQNPMYLQHFGGLSSNLVLPFFYTSPWYDLTSNNAVLVNQGQFNQALAHAISTREGLEARLKSMSGLEFMVAEEPAEMAAGTGTGVWVIRKQNRRKRPGQSDEITVLATYFIVNDTIFVAPALGDILNSRLLSVFTNLDKFVSKAAEVTKFTPSTGHTYFPAPSMNAKAETRSTQVSKETTPKPDALAMKKAQAASNALIDSRLLEESFNLSLAYGDEYMDENPITGHPGDFHLTSSGRAHKDKLAAPATRGPEEAAQKPEPPVLELKTSEALQSRKGSKVEKSPKTPGMPKPKRRKSKAVLSAGGTTPTA